MLTLNQIKAQVAAIRKKIPDANAIGIFSESRWGQTVDKEIDGNRFIISQCDSPLAMRIALRDSSADAIHVLVTNLNDQDLSDDILLRLKPRKLVSLDNWQIIKALFQAKTIDPRLSKYEWLPDALLEIQSADSWAPVPSGFLDAETIWPLILRHFLNFKERRPDLLSVLEWSADIENVKRFQNCPLRIRAAATEWMESQAGPIIAMILDCVESQQKADCLPLGLAMAVFAKPEHASSLGKALGKLEGGYLGNQSLDLDSIANWNAAAVEIATLRISDVRQKQQVLARSDEILSDVGAKDYAWLSQTSLDGYSQRLVNFGKRLTEMVDSNFETSLELLIEARNQVCDHHLATGEKRRLDRLDMALRLVGWASEEKKRPQPQAFGQSVYEHLANDGYVDWARLSLINAEPVSELSQAYTKLFRYCTSVREQHGKRFAELLSEYTQADSQDDAVIPVEKILERVVAPIAESNRVLLIVMDGMSVAVFRELMADLLERDWILSSPENRGLQAGLAVIPSVTEVSRASLLSGKLLNCYSDNEKKNFAANEALNSACRSGYPPVLFHKKKLQKPDDEEVDSEVRKEIGSAHRKIVGVVVNAIDDHLLKGDQLDVQWTREEIRGLATLLHEAKSSGRVVVMVSDHGHVLDFETTGQAKDKDEKSGERWRLDNGTPIDGELPIEGFRVTVPDLPDTKKLIAPWAERLRYGMKKNGYHGGISPQEMVIPIAVLTASDDFPPGWGECPVESPSWWEVESKITQSQEFPSVRLKPLTPPEPPPGMLFPVEEVEDSNQQAADSESDQSTEGDSVLTGELPVVNWIEALINSSIYENQRATAGRAVPNDELMRRLLTALHNHGGKLTSTALARSLNLSPMRLRGLLAISTRVLNVDGFPVFDRDEASDSISLNLELLLSQFDLGESCLP